MRRLTLIFATLLIVLSGVLGASTSGQNSNSNDNKLTSTAFPHPVYTYPPLSPDVIITPRKTDKPVVYIHVGPHKTGSTHIQTLLMQQQSWLSNFGFCTASFNVTERKNAKSMQLLVKELAVYGKRFITTENIDLIKFASPKGDASTASTLAATNGMIGTPATGGSKVGKSGKNILGEDDDLVNDHRNGNANSNRGQNTATAKRSLLQDVVDSLWPTTDVLDVDSSYGRRNLRLFGWKSSPDTTAVSSTVTKAPATSAATSSTPSTAVAGPELAPAANSSADTSTASPSHVTASSNKDNIESKPLTIKEKYQRIWPFTIHELEHCLEKSHQNMIISAENFMTLPLPQLVNLHYLLTEVYQVEVVYVAVYREYLNQVYSMYTQLTKLFHHSIRSFADHIFRASDSLDGNTVLNMNRIAAVITTIPHMMTIIKGSNGNVDGQVVNMTTKSDQVMALLQDAILKSNPTSAKALSPGASLNSITPITSPLPNTKFHIIDYYGTIAANIDIGYVLFCEIIGIGCQDNWLTQLNTHTTHENAAPTILYHQLYKLLRNFGLARNYRICSQGTILYDNHNRQYLSADRMNAKTARQVNEVVEAIIQSFMIQKKRFPNATSNLELFHPVSVAIDNQLRASYGSYILHNNATAHRDILTRLRITSLDEVPFYHDSRWVNWLQDELDRQVQAGRMCPMHVSSGKPSQHVPRIGDGPSVNDLLLRASSTTFPKPVAGSSSSKSKAQQPSTANSGSVKAQGDNKASVKVNKKTLPDDEGNRGKTMSKHEHGENSLSHNTGKGGHKKGGKGGKHESMM